MTPVPAQSLAPRTLPSVNRDFTALLPTRGDRPNQQHAMTLMKLGMSKTLNCSHTGSVDTPERLAVNIPTSKSDQNLVSEAVLAFYFHGYASQVGESVFGGIGTNHYSGELVYVRISQYNIPPCLVEEVEHHSSCSVEIPQCYDALITC